MKVEASIEPVRPFVVAGVVRGLTITDTMIRSLMEVQEKIHLTAGRKRMKVSIGIHDLSKVEPPFTYTAVKPEDVSFVPLGKTEPMNLKEILQRHEKGMDYAYILEGKERYPIIFDKNGEVLSFPPIINGILTTVTEETKDVFIDVTGTDLNAISGVLNIVATLLAERGGQIQSVKLTGSVHVDHTGPEADKDGARSRLLQFHPRTEAYRCMRWLRASRGWDMMSSSTSTGWRCNRPPRGWTCCIRSTWSRMWPKATDMPSSARQGRRSRPSGQSGRSSAPRTWSAI